MSVSVNVARTATGAPGRLRGALAVLEYHLLTYRRTWRGSSLSSFLLPLLTMLGFGVGVGSYVAGGVNGVPYLDYIVPGLIAVTAMQTAIGESTWPVLSGFQWTKTYAAQAAAALRVTDILNGHLSYVLLRVLLSSFVFLLVAAAFGALHSPWSLVAPPIAVLVGLAVAAPTFAFSASVTNDNALSLLYRFAVIPMTLFAGVFFPVESLPVALRWLAYLSPLWHGVDLCRAATLGVAPEWSALGHLLYLAAWSGGGLALAYRCFRSRLVI
ncbi:MAG TPA: ABC transporter permease [Micromonosporaceae bacterium]